MSIIYRQQGGNVNDRENRARSSYKVIAFIKECAVMDRIIDHLNQTFVAAKPLPSHVFTDVALMAAEESGEYF